MRTEQQRDQTPESQAKKRHKFRRNPALDLAYRIGVGVIGGLVLIGGIIMIPYPGPGWLVVFAGLAILATEFQWAAKALRFAKKYYDAWVAWLKRQHWSVRVLVIMATGAIVLATCWLLGVFSLVAEWFNLGDGWWQSPIF